MKIRALILQQKVELKRFALLPDSMMQVETVHAASRIVMGCRMDQYFPKQLHREDIFLQEQGFERIGKVVSPTG